MTEAAQYPVSEVQGLYRTVAELRQQVAMGRIESCWVAKRANGSGQNPVLWRVRA